MNKILAVGIVLLFVGVVVVPIINAQDNTKLIPIDTVSITVLEFRPDGTEEKTIVRMSHEQADNFHEEMTKAQDLDTRLSIYKKYNLISQNVTVDTLRAGMQEKAQRMGLTQDSLMSLIKSNRSLFQRHVYRNIFCSISGQTVGYAPLLIPFGTKWLLFILGRESLVFETVDFIIGGLPVYSKGLLGEIRCYADVLKMVGFVGVMYYFFVKDFGFELDGFCVYFKARAN